MFAGRLLRVIVLVLVFIPGTLALAQSVLDSNEGSRVQWDEVNEVWQLKWWGKLGHTYFIQYSEDLKRPWKWASVIESGDDSVKAWEFRSSGKQLFLRLRHTDIPTSDPDNADFDGDGLSNMEELLLGSDPFNIGVDTDGDGMPDWYEIANGLDLLKDDLLYDTDGDGFPNQWEYVKGTAAGNKEDFEADWIVDPANAGLSADDNIVGTIGEAIAAVPVDNGNWGESYRTILVKKGVYAEKVTIPSNKRIALIGERGATPVKLIGNAVDDYVMDVRGRAVVSGFWITRPVAAIANGTVTQAGIYASASGKDLLIVNCLISNHTAGIYIDWDGASVLIDHCTIFDNKTHGIYAEYRDVVQVASTILWNPQGTSANEYGGNYTAHTSGCLIRGGMYGGLNVDPLLKPNGTLSAGSGAIDADTGEHILGGDIQGDLRPYGNGRDIGADEYVDSDNDGLPDIWEMEYFGHLNENVEGDPDGDRLTNLYEYLFDLNPTQADTESHGLGDLYEALMDTDNPNYPAEWSVDTDGDGLTDGWELYYGTNPGNSDTNGDGVSDRSSFIVGIDPLNIDHDGDGLTNAEELAMGTNPWLSDTDGDGVPDGMDWYPNDPELWEAPIGNSEDKTGPVLTLFQPAGVVVTPY